VHGLGHENCRAVNDLVVSLVKMEGPVVLSTFWGPAKLVRPRGWPSAGRPMSFFAGLPQNVGQRQDAVAHLGNCFGREVLYFGTLRVSRCCWFSIQGD
jgi:hypothetical protein